VWFGADQADATGSTVVSLSDMLVVVRAFQFWFHISCMHSVLVSFCICSTHSSNFVMTAAAQNLLCLQLAAGIGVQFDDPFKTWLLGACVPATLGESVRA
jgi:hypothetical protein